MADEPKVPPQPSVPSEPPANSPAAQGGEVVPPAASVEKPAEAAAPEGEAAQAGSAAAPKPPSPAKPAAAAPPAKPPAPPKPPVKPDPWAGPLLEELKRKFPGAIADAIIFRKQPSVTVNKESLIAICEFLKGDEGGGYSYLADETAVDYPKREKRFDVIYELYSFKGNDRLRLKVLAADGEKIPSVAGVWPAANWLEREVFDMFGIFYEGHPDLRRILLPEEWVGHPLRKDYDILRQDKAWVQANLHIESGQ
jgi:NADH-quinone oxidoreductase subunit C